MWLVFLMLICIFGILTTTIEANLYRVELTEKSFNFKLIVSLKIFKFLNIINIDLSKIKFKSFNKKFDYRKLNWLRKIDFRFTKMYFTLNIGLEDMALTNIAIVIFSSIFPLLIKDRVKKCNFKYDIFPKYNKLYLLLKGKITLSVSLVNLIKLYFENIKSETTHNKNKNCDIKESLKYE